MHGNRKQERNIRLATYYAKGHSIREAAEHFGVSLQRVHQILERDYSHLIRAPHVGMQMSPAERIALGADSASE